MSLLDIIITIHTVYVVATTCLSLNIFVFFFKQKTAYEMRISDWSSDVCSSDLVFKDLPPGRYAVLAYHDENGNGELDRRFGMIPTEGYGLSNNPKVMGPPSFEDSAFEVPAGEPTRVTLEMRY